MPLPRNVGESEHLLAALPHSTQGAAATRLHVAQEGSGLARAERRRGGKDETWRRRQDACAISIKGWVVDGEESGFSVSRFQD